MSFWISKLDLGITSTTRISSRYIYSMSSFNLACLILMYEHLAPPDLSSSRGVLAAAPFLKVRYLNKIYVNLK
jgi:hypothetical protein